MLKKAFSLRPKFENWMYEDFIAAEIPYIDVMTCKEFDKKYINKLHGIWLANQKYDGNRAVCIVTPEGNRFFSRRISKKTNWFSENTDCVPHLRDLKGLPVGTILDGELCYTGKTSKEVQSVTGSLPENAIKFQKENGWIEYVAFDLLQLGEDNYEAMSYIFRASMLQQYNIFSNSPIYVEGEDVAKLLKEQNNLDTIPVKSFKELRNSFWAEGKEGLIIKHGMSQYQQGKRANTWLKVKEVKTADVIICGFQEATKYYDGKTLKEKGYWDYWVCYDDADVPIHRRMRIEEAGEYAPITKPYAMGWIGAIEFGLLKDGKVVKIGEAKGISDADLEYISEHEEELIGTVIEVKYQEIINKETKSLRHPRFNRFREDKGAESCTWDTVTKSL